MGPSVAAIAISGCPVSEPNPGHCSNGRGDEFCVEEHGIAAPFCAIGMCELDAPDGCVGDRPSNDCWSPCGQGQTAIENDPDFDAFFDSLTGMLEILLPRYEQEGKSYLTIAVGCTGGRHRSVYVARKLNDWLLARDWRVRLQHRDIHAGGGRDML